MTRAVSTLDVPSTDKDYKEAMTNRIMATFKTYVHMSASTKMEDDPKVEAIGNQLEFLLQQYKNQTGEDFEFEPNTRSPA